MARPRSLSISSQKVTKSRLFFTNYTLISGITSIQISCYSIKLVIDKQKITFPFLKKVKFHLLCHFIKINSVKSRLSQHLPIFFFLVVDTFQSNASPLSSIWWGSHPSTTSLINQLSAYAPQRVVSRAFAVYHNLSFY